MSLCRYFYLNNNNTVFIMTLDFASCGLPTRLSNKRDEPADDWWWQRRRQWWRWCWWAWQLMILITQQQTMRSEFVLTDRAVSTAKSAIILLHLSCFHTHWLFINRYVYRLILCPSQLSCCSVTEVVCIWLLSAITLSLEHVFHSLIIIPSTNCHWWRQTIFITSLSLPVAPETASVYFQHLFR